MNDEVDANEVANDCSNGDVVGWRDDDGDDMVMIVILM